MTFGSMRVSQHLPIQHIVRGLAMAELANSLIALPESKLGHHACIPYTNVHNMCLQKYKY